jgi:hypothetical protein
MGVTMSRSIRSLSYASIAGILLLTACDGGFTDAALDAPGVGRFALAPSGITLEVGDTMTVVANLTRNGNRINPRSLKWESTVQGAAAVDRDGRVAAHGAGHTKIIASTRQLADTTEIRVVHNGASKAGISVSPHHASLDWIGASLDFRANIYDGAGALVANPDIEWKTVDSQIAEIDAMGRVTARGVGVALIVAACLSCDRADTAHANVRQVVTEIRMDSFHVQLAPGESRKVEARALDAGGTEVSDASVTWVSDDRSVATVSQSGVVTARALGTAQVTATSGDAAMSTAVTVAGEARQWPGGGLPLQLRRLNNGTGTVRVSSGILMPAGAVWESDIPRIAVAVGGTEVQAYVEALHGRHRDGSVISVLVQFDANPDLQREAKLKFNVAPSQPRLSKQPVDFRNGATLNNVMQTGYPAGVAMPPLDHMTAAFSLFGPTVAVADARAMGPEFTNFENDFEKWSAIKWDDWQAYLDAGNQRERIIGSNYYDRGYHHMAWFARTRDPEYFRRGASYTFNYRYHYYEHNNYGIAQERLWLSEGLAAHYWLTGDEESREAVRRLAARNASDTWSFSRMRPCNYRGDARAVARALSSLTWAARLGHTDRDWRNEALAYVDLIAAGGTEGNLWGTDPNNYRYGAWVFRHPDYPAGAGCTVAYVSNFMNAMIMDALITVYDHVEPDPRIPATVKRNLDYLRSSQWRGRGGNGMQLTKAEPSPSFNYYDVQVAGSGSPSNGQVDLNGFFVNVFAWYGRHSGNDAYMEIARQAFATLAGGRHDGAVNPWFRERGADKQFNETFQKAWQMAGYQR